MKKSLKEREKKKQQKIDNPIPCVLCGEDMPLLRLERFGYKFCISCSPVSKKSAAINRYIDDGNEWTEMKIK